MEESAEQSAEHQSSEPTPELLVFGAGQMRTGTASLRDALEYLYDGKCNHMQEILDHPDHIDIWQKSANQRKLTKESAMELFHGYVASVGYPTSGFYKDLCEIYPNAKVILTMRDPDCWLRSVRHTTLSKKGHSLLEKAIFHLTGFHRLKSMGRSIMELTMKRSKEQLMCDQLLKERYIKYNEKVQRIVPKERLLVFQARTGWEPLCKFLGKPIPDFPYPDVNTTAEFLRGQTKRFRRVMFKILCPVFVLLVGTAVLAFK